MNRRDALLATLSAAAVLPALRASASTQAIATPSVTSVDPAQFPQAWEVQRSTLVVDGLDPSALNEKYLDMVTRKDYEGRVWGANQKVTVDEALRIATINGAHASYEENVKDSITVGKLADFVILEKDPHAVDPDTLKDIKIVRTVVGGKTVYSRA